MIICEGSLATMGARRSGPRVALTTGDLADHDRSVIDMDERTLARFLAKIRVDDTTGCWLWTAALVSGYGRFSVRVAREGKTRDRYMALAHRVSYEHFVGVIPNGYQIDHLCRVPACVNPAHLEAVTPRINSLRSTSFAAQNAVKVRCPRGHPYTPENTRTNALGWRWCRTCHREWNRREYALRNAV